MISAGSAWVDGSVIAELEALRTPAGVVRLDGGLVAVIGHAAALEVLTDARRFTSSRGTGLSRVSVPGASLNLSDPPKSTALRRLLGNRSLPSLEALRERASRLISPLVARGEAELVTEFCRPFALATFGEVFGVTDAALLAELGEAVRRIAAQGDDLGRADAELRSMLRHRSNLFFEDEPALDENDALFLRRLLAQTGFESTAMALALSVELLLERDLPFDARPAAADELLRVTSPLIRFARETTAATTLGGLELEVGTRVAVFFPLVNRDPAVFARPHDVDLERAPNPHLSFGAGAHHCFGAPLARAQLQATLGALSMLPRPTVHARAPLVSTVTRGLTRLQLAW